MELIHDFGRALDSLSRYLTRRDHSELELKQKLSRRYTPEIVTRAVQHAHDHKWIRPPEELAEIWTRQLGQKKRSHRYITGYLRKRGIPATSPDPEFEVDKCRRLLETKFHKTVNFTFEEKTKAYRFLAYRGFNDAVIKRVINEKS